MIWLNVIFFKRGNLYVNVLKYKSDCFASNETIFRCPTNDRRGRGLSTIYHYKKHPSKVEFIFDNPLINHHRNNVFSVHCEVLLCVKSFTIGVLGLSKVSGKICIIIFESFGKVYGYVSVPKFTLLCWSTNGQS